MRKGFTLLELIVVIIILGVLATLGFTQYGGMVEKSRNAEAKAILGDLRKFAAAWVMENGVANIGTMTNGNLNMGAGMDKIPDLTCRTSHYFSYAQSASNPLVLTANRCTAGGKTPNATAGGTLILTTDLTTGVDVWGGTRN